MARRKQTADPALPDLPPGLIDQLAAGVKTPADFQQVYRAFQKALTEKGLQAERTHHLGYPVREGRAPDGNARNGTTPKRVATDTGTLDLAIPRDRDSAFAPQFVPKGVRRLPGFDETVLALYARGLTTRELQGFSRGAVSGGGLARPDQHRDECGARRGGRVAEPPARARVHRRGVRCATGEDPRRRRGAE